jgi:hypothetical protein
MCKRVYAAVVTDTKQSAITPPPRRTQTWTISNGEVLRERVNSGGGQARDDALKSHPYSAKEVNIVHK